MPFTLNSVVLNYNHFTQGLLKGDSVLFPKTSLLPFQKDLTGQPKKKPFENSLAKLPETVCTFNLLRHWNFKDHNYFHIYLKYCLSTCLFKSLTVENLNLILSKMCKSTR